MDDMRKLLRWIEFANTQEGKGRKLKRQKRRIELIQKLNARKWLGPGIEEVIDLKQLKIKVALQFDDIIDQRDNINERKI